jgi:hypothetical protein
VTNKNILKYIASMNYLLRIKLKRISYSGTAIDSATAWLEMIFNSRHWQLIEQNFINYICGIKYNFQSLCVVLAQMDMFLIRIRNNICMMLTTMPNDWRTQPMIGIIKYVKITENK